MEEQSKETPEAPKAAPSNGGDNKVMAILAYFGILLLIPLLTDAKNDPFVKFHIKQGLLLLIAYIVVGVVYVIPVLGWILGSILYVFLFVLFIMGIINASSGKQTPLPVIGKWAEGWNI